MNDQEYIIEAAGLADGWTLTDAGAIHSPFCERWFDIPPELLSRPHKAALAAQLVEQVDALGFFECNIDGGGTSITCPSNDEFSPVRVWGNDRAMNTIKVVVDSRVLP